MKKTVEKQILRYGEWNHPHAKNGKLSITKDYVSQIIKNFTHTPFVPVLRGHVDNSEAEKNPDLVVSKNIKELKADEKGLNAVFEIEESELEKYNDVSASIDESYENHETGNVIGATLKHIALVIDPYMKGLNHFVPLQDKMNYLIHLSEITMAKEEKTPEVETVANLEEVKEEVVEETTTTEVTEPEKKEEAVVETEVVEPETTPETPEVEVEKTETKSETVDSSETQKEIVSLQEQLKQQNIELADLKAEKKVVSLKEAGKVTPAMEEAVKVLYKNASSTVNLADGSVKTTSDLLDEMFSKMPTIVNFGERGVNLESVNEDTSTLKSGMIELWRKQYPNLSDAQLEEKYVKSATKITEVAKKY